MHTQSGSHFQVFNPGQESYIRGLLFVGVLRTELMRNSCMSPIRPSVVTML
jgi:hypothetical protein